jgi:hypothetical protein
VDGIIASEVFHMLVSWSVVAARSAGSA